MVSKVSEITTKEIAEYIRVDDYEEQDYQERTERLVESEFNFNDLPF